MCFFHSVFDCYFWFPIQPGNYWTFQLIYYKGEDEESSDNSTEDSTTEEEELDEEFETANAWRIS